MMRLLALCGLLLAPAWAHKVAYNTTSVRHPTKLNVHFVVHSHLDPGWKWTFEQYYRGRDDARGAVQYIYDAVLGQLCLNKDRTFELAEMSYFNYWWDEQNNATKEVVRDLVKRGQLEFVNGGWVQHDEACTDYVTMIDQTTRGHRFLSEEFGVQPRVGWLTDNFGHSSTQASLMSASAGWDAIVFFRAPWDDYMHLRDTKATEMVWGGCRSCADQGDIFAVQTYSYTPPRVGLSFEWPTQALQNGIVDDPTDPLYNLPQQLEVLEGAIQEIANWTVGNDIMIFLGDDFAHMMSQVWFNNIDKMIHYTNAKGTYNAMYSTLERYVDAKSTYNHTWPWRTHDFFPYADNMFMYWVGYYSSRPSLKLAHRQGQTYLQAARQLEALAPVQVLPPGISTDPLEAAVALTSHHDAITGTCTQKVANDYMAKLTAGMTEARSLINAALEYLILSTSSSPSDPGTDAVTPPRPLDLVQCPLLNISVCTPTVSRSRVPSAMSVVVYNQLGGRRVELVRVPLAGDEWRWAVTDHKGRGVVSQMVPVHPRIQRLQKLQQELQQASPGSVDPSADAASGSGSHELVFAASLPPMGAVVFSLRPLKVDEAHLQVSAPSELEEVEIVIPIEEGEEEDDEGKEEDAAAAKAAALLQQQKMRQQQQQRAIQQQGMESLQQHTLEHLQAAADAIAAGTGNVAVETDPGQQQDTDLQVTKRKLAQATDDAGQQPKQHGGRAKATNPKAKTLRANARPTAKLVDGKAVHITKLRADVTVTNGIITLIFNGSSGELELVARGDLVLPISVGLMTYRVAAGPASVSGQSDEVLKAAPDWAKPFNAPAGAYIFRPDLSPPFRPAPIGLTVVRGPVLTEVRQVFSDSLHLTYRLWRGTPYVEMDWVVGPLDHKVLRGVEVALEYASGLSSGDRFWTDANSREWQPRVRNKRPTYDHRAWKVSPVPSNYYPLTAGMFIRDDKGQELSVLVDRPQAGGSIRPGQMELLLHRRVPTDDDKGLGEGLEEDECGCHEDTTQCHCPKSYGLTARGTHYLLLGKGPAAAKQRRRRALAFGNLPVVAFGRHRDENEKWWNALSALQVSQGAPLLPPNVHLLTLKRLGRSRLLLRLAHMYQLGEHPVMSKPATLDLNHLLYRKLPIRTVVEMSLTTNQRRKVMRQRRTYKHGPMDTSNHTVPLDAIRSQLHDYDPRQDAVECSSGCSEQQLLVTLNPMEVRTFELTLGTVQA